MHVGNILWNEYEVMLNGLVGLLNHLAQSRKWYCMEGWTILYDKFNHPDLWKVPITSIDLEFDYKVGEQIFSR